MIFIFGVTAFFTGTCLFFTSTYLLPYADDRLTLSWVSSFMGEQFNEFFPSFIRNLLILVADRDISAISSFILESEMNKIAYFFFKMLIFTSPTLFEASNIVFFSNFEVMDTSLKYIAEICFSRFMEHAPNYDEMATIIRSIEEDIVQPEPNVFQHQPPVSTPPHTSFWTKTINFCTISKYIGGALVVVGIACVGYAGYSGDSAVEGVINAITNS